MFKCISIDEMTEVLESQIADQIRGIEYKRHVILTFSDHKTPERLSLIKTFDGKFFVKLPFFPLLPVSSQIFERLSENDEINSELSFDEFFESIVDKL